MSAASPALDATTVIADLLARGHEVQFRARGCSMDPVIRSEDFVTVAPVRDVAVGDVVLTLRDARLVAHRIVRVGETTLVTRGDNASSDDLPVSPSQVLGRVHTVLRDGKPRPVVAESLLVRALRRVYRWFR